MQAVHSFELLIDGIDAPAVFQGIVKKGFCTLSWEAKGFDGLELPYLRGTFGFSGYWERVVC